ncbi:MAG: EF-hand domain-containing protein [Gemmataceae bacterium]
MVIVTNQQRHRLTVGTGLVLVPFLLILLIASVHGQQTGQQQRGEGQRPDREGLKDKKAPEGQGQQRRGEGDRPGIRGIITKHDKKKQSITVVQRRDAGTKVFNFSIANKDIRVTGLVKKLADLRTGIQVVVIVSEDNDVLSIDTGPARRRRGSRIERIFAAYDKNGNQKVEFKEWIGMKEGKFNAARTALEKKRFDKVDTDRNGSLSLPEFIRWRTPNRPAAKEGNRQRGPRDGEADRKRGPRDGENKAKKRSQEG